MKDYKVYVCEKCGKEFPNDREGCEVHEAGHVSPEPYQIRRSGTYNQISRYPAGIKIPMEDGAEVMYKFDSIVKEPQKEESPCSNTDDLKENL